MRITWPRVEPMTCAASTVPEGISRSADSTRRAKNGAVPMVREMVAAMGPIAVPTSHLVSGMSATMRMAYGIDLVMLTITADSTV